MATMYYLLFSILFIGFWNPLGTHDHTIERKHELRQQIIAVAQAELGVKESTGNNDGDRVEEYLAYTHLGKGYAWCAAFISWCYGKVGLPAPRNPWSPALFPLDKTYCKGNSCRNAGIVQQIREADVFGIYGHNVRRINHVGLVSTVQHNYILTIEGNSNNRVASRRRHLSTIYALSNWVGGE